MQRLPKGVTGFDAPDQDVAAETFTAACQAAARQIGGRVHKVQSAYEQVTPNFHQALIAFRYGTEIVRVLCNAHYPIVAFATPQPNERDTRLEFRDCPELADVLRADYTILSRAEACAGVSNEVVAQLGAAETNQMRYWRPQRIGDVVFNYWD